MTLTYEVANLDGLIANLYAKDRRVARSVRSLNEEFAETAREIAFQLCPKDTTWMSTHIRKRISDEGLTWAIGWDAEDFVGVVNPVSGKIMSFYPPEVEMGGFNRSPQPTLRPTMDALRDEYKERLNAVVRAAFRRERG